MGGFFSRIWQRFLRRAETRLVVLGLDAAGKTTFLTKLALGDPRTVVPTVGFNVQRLDFRNIHFTIWDVCGQEKTRPLWVLYLDNTQAMVYIIDSNDRQRIDESIEELDKIIREPSIKGKPLLIFCNKQDLPNAMQAEEISRKISLADYKRPFHVQPLCAISGQGVQEGLDWLANTLKSTQAH